MVLSEGKQKTPPEFTRPLSIEALILDKPRNQVFEASKEECAALAKRFGLRALSNFKADVTVLRASQGKILRVDGKVEADLVQACVVSLQDVSEKIDFEFQDYFTEDGKPFDPAEDFIADEGGEDEEDPFDVIEEGNIDVGELVAQNFSLEINPYPRAEGVSLDENLKPPKKANPFAVLEGLKDKGSNG